MKGLSEENIGEKLLSWVRNSCRGVSPDEINTSTPLIGTGILDSFALLSLASLIEELLGRKIPSQELVDIDRFMTVDKILNNYFKR